MRISNLKFLGVALFTMFLLIGGFIINVAKTEAASTVQSLGVTYTLSSIISATNNDGSVTTKVLVGCAPKSGDLYDINTGKPCTNNVKTVLTGCAIGSGDIYDVNTGIPCASYIKSVLAGCVLKSGDIYDTNTGNKCTNDTSKVIARLTPKDTLTQKDLALLTPNGSLTGSITGNKEVTTTTVGSDLSGREVLANSLSANAGKAKEILKSPMSIWIILLIIAILLGGGYAAYSLLKKGKRGDIKQPASKPVTPITAIPNPQVKPVTPSTPVSTQPKVNTEQTQYNNPQNNINPSVTPQNTPTPQGH